MFSWQQLPSIIQRTTSPSGELGLVNICLQKIDCFPRKPMIHYFGQIALFTFPNTLVWLFLGLKFINEESTTVPILHLWPPSFGILLTLNVGNPLKISVSYVASQDRVEYCYCGCYDPLGGLSQSSCFFYISLSPRGGSGIPCAESISHAWSLIHKLTVCR